MAAEAPMPAAIVHKLIVNNYDAHSLLFCVLLVAVSRAPMTATTLGPVQPSANSRQCFYLGSGSAGGARHCGAPMLRRYAATSALLPL